MKIAVCIATQDADAYGYLQRYADQFSWTARCRGVDVEILRYPEDDFYPRLVKNLSDESCVIHFYGYLFNFSLPGHWNGGGDAVNIIDYSRATTVATIGDHPFSTFMHGTVENAHPSTKFIVMERSFQEEVRTMKPALADAVYDHQPIPPPTNYDCGKKVAFNEREFDLVVPMYFAAMAGRDINFLLSKLTADWFAEIAAITYETARTAVDRSPFLIFCEVFQAKVGLTLDEVRERNPAIMGQIVNVISGIDGIIRQERRKAMLGSLLRSVDGLKVAVTSNPIQDLEVDERVQFVGPRPVGETADLMANARATLNCNPSYPSSLHERVVSSMLYGSCVITDINRCIGERFCADEFVPYGLCNAMTIADIYDSYDVESIAAAGASKVCADRSYSWDGHLDRLLQTAAA
jgi:hypothetical protein